jgi:UDPglucose 6-dehydrogenase
VQEAVFIWPVGTPTRRGDGHADLTFVMAVAEEIALVAKSLQSSSPSTVPLLPTASQQVIHKADLDFDVASTQTYAKAQRLIFHAP